MTSKKESKEIAKKINSFIKNEDIIAPLNWVYPDKKEFINWINQTFLKYRATGKEVVTGKTFIPFNYQKLVKDYMQNNSPYRGVLLYYALGAGKTCTAITIAENLKTERNIVVMLPASLRTNFIYDGLMYCGDTEYKINPELYKEKYSFISYNANNTVAQIKKIGSLDNKVIIIDEVHNLISKMMSGISGSSKQGFEIYNLLMNAQNVKIVALSGTPIINDAFEAAILFNILRGFIEITYFKIIKVPTIFGNSWNLEQLEKELMEHKFIDYLEINKINRSIEFHIKVKNYSDIYRETLEQIEEICKKYGVIVKFLELKKIPLFPTEDEGRLFRDYFIKEDSERRYSLKNEEVFKRRVLGLVSYYKSNDSNYPSVNLKDYYRVSMSNYQFQIFDILRSKERLSERGSSKSKAGQKKDTVKSTFRVFSRQASNFVFPEEINRPYPDPNFIVSIKTKNEKSSKDDEKTINKVLKLEESANNDGKLSEDYKNRIQEAIDKLQENGDVYFRPGPEGLNKLSPKMKLMLENIQASPGLVFVYSNFRTLEGIELFSRVLDFNGFSKYQIKSGKSKNKTEKFDKSEKSDITENKKNSKYAIYSGMEDEKEKKDILNIFKSNENKTGNIIKIILATAAGAEGLDLKNIRQIHIMEPYWNQMRIEQVIGRGVRRNSHMALPLADRNVEVFRYFSVFTEPQKMVCKDKLSTDEYIEQISLKKQSVINELLTVFKECAFDCVLNAPDIKGDYNCFSFGKDASGVSYYPSISKDIIEFSSATENRKTIKITFTKGIIYKNGKVYLYDNKDKKFYLYHDEDKKSEKIDLKKVQPIFIDKKTDTVYDAKSIEQSIIIGKINKDGEFRKIK
jgi:superfamily II DNA or RNA helicase